LDPNDYRNYIKPFLDEEVSKGKHKVKYTIHIHRAMFNPELYELYKKYELAVHKKERPED
jgi:arginyl-tRNA--protein-N-Asp/Glu arginylyltransferase